MEKNFKDVKKFKLFRKNIIKKVTAVLLSTTLLPVMGCNEKSEFVTDETLGTETSKVSYVDQTIEDTENDITEGTTTTVLAYDDSDVPVFVETDEYVAYDEEPIATYDYSTGAYVSDNVDDNTSVSTKSEAVVTGESVVTNRRSSETTTVRLSAGNSQKTVTTGKNGTTTTGKRATTTTKTTTKATTTTTKATTKAITTTEKPVTTTEVTTTTEVVTQPIIRDFTKYDLLNPDTAVASAAFEQLATKLCEELYNGYGFDREYGYSNGYAECRVMLATLNHDQGISPEVLASEQALGSYSEQDVFNYSHTVSFGFLERATGSRVDFTKYVLNEDLANFINNMNDLWINYMNGDKNPYNEAADNYYAYNNYDNVAGIDDYLKFYYMAVSDYNTFDNIVDDYSVDVIRQLYDDNIVRPIYDSYVPYKGYSR